MRTPLCLLLCLLAFGLLWGPSDALAVDKVVTVDCDQPHGAGMPPSGACYSIRSDLRELSSTLVEFKINLREVSARRAQAEEQGTLTGCTQITSSQTFPSAWTVIWFGFSFLLLLAFRFRLRRSLRRVSKF